MERFQDVVLTVEDRRADIRLNLPASHNALTYRMIAELKAAIAHVGSCPDVAVLVLSGAGRSFCSGDNLKDMGPVPHDGDLLQTTMSESYHAVVTALREIPLPVVTLGHGHVLGAGLELFMAGDIKVATRDVTLGIPFARLGLAAMNYHLPRQIGFTRAARLLFSGDPIDGATAVDWGLATEMVDGQAQLEERANYWADRFRALSTTSIGTMKRTFYQSYETEERHWYSWWTSQWINFLDRQRAAGQGWPKP